MFGVGQQLSDSDKAQINDRIALVKRFVESDGWKLYASMLQDVMNRAEQDLRVARDSYSGQQSSAIYFTAKGFLTWPEREVQALRTRLDSGV